MADFFGELEDTTTGDRWPFSDRSEYLATLYGGGMREIQPPDATPTRELADPRPSQRPAATTPAPRPADN